jgi:hypothetical protein
LQLLALLNVLGGGKFTLQQTPQNFPLKCLTNLLISTPFSRQSSISLLIRELSKTIFHSEI